MLSHLSNPFSSGGGGVHFENHVQSLYVAIMLSGGCAPPLDDCRINEIKLQGKVDGYNTDDLIVFGEIRNSQRPRKLLGQIKRSILITNSNSEFAATLAAMWSDFNNPKIFTKGKGADVLALLTGPISTTDYKNVQWLLHHAKTHDSTGFYRDVKTAKFGPPERQEKLEVFRHHINNANGSDVSDEELHVFLKHFYWLGFDLGEETGVVRSLLQSHLSMFNPPCPISLFARICDFVVSWNQRAGTITQDQVPSDILEAFEPKERITAPKYAQPASTPDWNQHEHAPLLAVLNLIGQWRENRPDDLSALFSGQRSANSSDDISVLNTIIGEDQSICLPKLRDMLQPPDSPLSLQNGIWRIENRIDLWSSLGSRLFDEHLERFKQAAITVLTERNPAFDLENDKRWAANVYGKTQKFSPQIRNGIAGGLALLGSKPQELSHCSAGKAEGAAIIAVREILSNADWVLWGSLQDVLPALAEAAPQTFLEAIEKALQASPCPFDELFAQESQGITGQNYMTGLLWALESLAWDAEYLSHVCLILGQLASRDPGGNWGNRPSHSLTTILLPWLPQTLAPIEKRQADDRRQVDGFVSKIVRRYSRHGGCSLIDIDKRGVRDHFADISACLGFCESFRPSIRGRLGFARLGARAAGVRDPERILFLFGCDELPAVHRRITLGHDLIGVFIDEEPGQNMVAEFFGIVNFPGNFRLDGVFANRIVNTGVSSLDFQTHEFFERLLGRVKQFLQLLGGEVVITSLLPGRCEFLLQSLQLLIRRTGRLQRFDFDKLGGNLSLKRFGGGFRILRTLESGFFLADLFIEHFLAGVAFLLQVEHFLNEKLAVFFKKHFLGIFEKRFFRFKSFQERHRAIPFLCPSGP